MLMDFAADFPLEDIFETLGDDYQYVAAGKKPVSVKAVLYEEFMDQQQDYQIGNTFRTIEAVAADVGSLARGDVFIRGDKQFVVETVESEANGVIIASVREAEHVQP